MKEQFEKIDISGVQERDIDLLILEEFYASDAFWSWFVIATVGTRYPPHKFIKAQRSVTQSNGESDVELFFESDAGDRYCLLIENKVQAGFQPLQAQRYRKRGVDYVKKGDCMGFATVLIAPRNFLNDLVNTEQFDCSLCYEQLADWFEQETSLGNRRIYKLSLLRRAITKAKRASGNGPGGTGDAKVGQRWRIGDGSQRNASIKLGVSVSREMIILELPEKGLVKVCDAKNQDLVYWIARPGFGKLLAEPQPL